MARSYSRITSTIWRDDDFVALPPEQKLTYLMLISQPDVSPCGLLSVTLRRWAMSLGMDLDELSNALDGLVKARFVLWDEAHEELLIRSFVRWDGGLGNENRTKAIIAAVEAIRSADIFNAALRELDRLGASHGLEPRQTVPNHGLRTASERPSNDVQTDSEGPRVVVKEGDHLEPQPTTLTPAQRTLRASPRFEEFWAAYPRRTAKQAARRKWDTLTRSGVDPQAIIDGAKRYAEQVRGSEPQFIKQPDGWLNAGRWEDEPTIRPAVRRPFWEN